MKRLLIIRHAKSSWVDTGLRDYDRPLNARGEHDAPLMGRYMARQGWRPQLVLCSAARRTKQTAMYLLSQLDEAWPRVQWEEGLYLADASTLLHYIHATPPDIETLAVIAHNPGVSELFYRLCGKDAETMPTCAVAVIHCPETDWSGLYVGNRTAFVYPKQIRQEARQ